jgi:protein KTI12
MALIMVSGLPCSGRTRRSKELAAEFERRLLAQEDASSVASTSRRKLRIVHLTNEDANVDRTAFATQLKEKPARAAFLSLGMRSVAKDAIVICDGGAGLNIKGFRYQLWCAAREVGVRSVSILCVAHADTCRRRNRRRQRHTETNGTDEPAYEDNTFEEMLMRFEEPNAMTRWDAPLFVLDCNAVEGVDEDQQEGSWEDAPFDAIWQAVTKGDLAKAPDVVAPVRATSSNYLSVLETTTQLVLSALQTLAGSGALPEMGGLVKLAVAWQQQPNATYSVDLYLPAGKRAPATSMLQRLRRQFVKMHASSAASQNEIGHAMEQEAGNDAASSQDRFRGQRKSQQHARNGGSEQGGPRSTEEEIARRFVAYLEETL